MRESLKLATLLVPLALGWAVLGCSKQSNNNPGFGQTSSASTAAGITAPQGPFQRGTVDPSLLPDPATTGPELSVVSPQRGASVQDASVAVVISAVDSDGVADVTIGGNPATSSGTDLWTASVQLQAGMNVVEFSATDSLGNETSGYLSLTQGQLHSTQDVLREGVGLAMTPAGLGRVADVVADLTSAVDLAPLIVKHNPLLSVAGLKLNGTGLTHAPLHYELEGAPDGLLVRVHIDTAVLTGDAQFIGIGLTTLSITADRVTAVARPRISQSSYTGQATANKQALGLEIDRLDISMTNFGITAQSGFFNAILGSFKKAIEDKVKTLLEGILMDLVVDELNKAIPTLDSAITLNLPNPVAGTQHPLDLQFEVHEASGAAPTGVVMNMGLKVAAKSPLAGTSDQVALQQIAPSRPLTPGPETFAIQLSQDALNSFMHAVWQTGIIEAQIEGRNPSPTAKTALTVNYLYPFLPVVKSIAPDPGTPLTIRIRSGSAPQLNFGAQPGVPYQVALGEGEIELLIDYMDGLPPLSLFTLRFAAVAEATVVIENDKIKVANLKLPKAHVDIIAEPVADLADQEIEDFVHAILPQLLDTFKISIPEFKIPALPMGLTLTSPKITVDRGFIRVNAGL
jgi:hypothetical protein